MYILCFLNICHIYIVFTNKTKQNKKRQEKKFIEKCCL